jgi:hypothetical protein
MARATESERDELRSDLGGPEHRVDRRAADRADRHSGVLRLLGVLDQRDPAAALERREALRAVVPRAR